MFRLLPITLLLILSRADIVHAGLDTNGCECEFFYTFCFNTTKVSQKGRTYIPDPSAQGHVGFLFDGASLSDNGKDGKCLHLQGDDIFASGTTIVPLTGHFEFFIAAWVKMPRQREVSVKLHVVSSDTEDDAISNFHYLAVTTDGNLRAKHSSSNPDITYIIETEGQNVSDNEWHHIAYTKTLSTYRLFINGEVITSEYKPDLRFFSFEGNRLTSFIGTLNDQELTGNVYVDDFIATSIGLSPYDIKGLYEDSVMPFLETMPVNPQGRLATTWGELKSQ